MDLTTPLTYVKGIGPARAAMLQAKGLVTVEDLLGYVPFRYEDRSNMKTIAQLAPGEMATVIADVSSARLSGFRRRNLGLFEVRFTDRSRATLAGSAVSGWKCLSQIRYFSDPTTNMMSMKGETRGRSI